LQKLSLIRLYFFFCSLEKSWCETSSPSWLGLAVIED
jgi:hypothetical protein